MSEDLISVIDVAKEIGKHKAYVFKIINRLGIETVKEKNSDAKGQKIAFITSVDYDRLKEYLVGNADDPDSPTVQPNIGGVFYLIQLEPEHDPCRFKVGFTTNIEERLRSHKTVAPFSKILKIWPCKLLWEKTAIESVTNGCERLHTEVFRAESIAEVQVKGNQFFALMPAITAK